MLILKVVQPILQHTAVFGGFLSGVGVSLPLRKEISCRKQQTTAHDNAALFLPS